MSSDKLNKKSFVLFYFKILKAANPNSESELSIPLFYYIKKCHCHS